MFGIGMPELLVMVGFIVAVPIVIKMLSGGTSRNIGHGTNNLTQTVPQVLSAEQQWKRDAERHYKKGNNVWADSFTAALAEFEIAVQLDPDNPEYHRAVAHAKRNIEMDNE